jgi:hypothetical protein
MKWFRFRRSTLLISSPILAATLSGCGSDSSTTAPTPVVTPAPTPAPAVTTTLFQGGISGLEPNTIAQTPVLTTSARGTLKGHVNWTFADDHILLYLTEGSCSFSQLTASQCNVVALSESKTPKPRNVVYENAPPGDYLLWVGNLGPNTEAISVQVTLTTGGSASSLSRPERYDAAYAREFKDTLTLP